MFEDAGIAVVIGAVVALLFFADRVSHGYFDIIFNYKDGSKKEIRKGRTLHIPNDDAYTFVTYSIAGSLGYLDSSRHEANIKTLAHSNNIPAVIVRLRNLFSLDYEAEEMLAASIQRLLDNKKEVYISSSSSDLLESLLSFEVVKKLQAEGRICAKTQDAIAKIASKA